MKSMRASILWLLIAAQPALAQLPRLDALGDPLPAGAIARLGTVRYRIGSVASFALSPDGKTLAVETANQLVLWDIDSGKPVLRVPFLRTGYFDERIKNRLVFASDGKSIVHLDNVSVRGYGATTGRQLFKTEVSQ